MVPSNRLHDVDHHITEVHQHPLASVGALYAEHLRAGLANFVVHAFCKGPGLAVAGAAGHDHAVKEGGDGGGVKDLNVLGLDIL